MKALSKLIFIPFFIILQSSLSFGQDLRAYQIFSANGDKSSYPALVKQVQGSDLVFFGELHNNSIAHWLQVELAKDLFEAHRSNFIMGAEMFEADDQLIIDEYLKGMFADKKFEADARLWPNYETDYKALLVFAKENSIPFIATNIPRRYASMVLKKGFDILDSLSTEAKNHIAELPVPYDPELGCYKSMLNMGGMGMHMTNKNLPKAQAIKDATMAHFIVKNTDKGKSFLHFNGAFHSDNHEGIVWYLNQYAPELTYKTITTVLQSDISSMDASHQGKADFIIVVDEDLPGSY